ncbi:RecQ family ATP-dependent DNA helicase [Rhizobium lentis]|uniref:RecQ family ATP-dependent DNA helicase n=1 Tax=Rhizobium lentis TaxID=1138194 RepID=UPI001C84049F|nr:RecQ family ATP-dependent DNA helicase [Rhizobium lentis]MBX4954735.1 RecQ family ATP-dependent DNA helicase [Rhizobium lentis]MBX5034546.1 RecQ family ATP-dependent DNA helicase [Rhizobium lentis]
MDGAATHRTDDSLVDRCLSIDLEVDPSKAQIFTFAAVRHADGEKAVFRNGNQEAALDRLEDLASEAEFLLGHNIIRFDLPHLAAVRPQFAELATKAIDTLWLNPLAFPRNPYHHLVKHHHDGRLQVGHVNDPELDARLVLEVLANQIAAFAALARETPSALVAYHYLTTCAPESGGFDALFTDLRRAPRPSAAQAEKAMMELLAGQACDWRIRQTLNRLSSPQLGWPMAYALSWISVAGGDSVMPPWVRAQFREASLIVRHLRDRACDDPVCRWCREKNDPKKALSRWFGFDSFRPEPKDDAGRPLQERIVAETMGGKSVLGILPTGTGKSICYQIPALARFDKVGALSVVISPLVALMADQVQGLARHGISGCVTINGLLSMPERHAALDQVRMGDAAILLISPEQLRSPSVRSVLAQREIGYWILDEAHCVSKWGHDFRPDYRYVSRFIREYSGGEEPAPVVCLTATAKPEVVRDIQDHFQARLGVELMLLDGGATRHNLAFEVHETHRSRKLADILDTIERALPREGVSGAVVYCATRSATERVAGFLQQQGLAADFFHAGLTPERKQEVQERFRVGELRVIAATNAFGMGIDKPDIRLVVHGDIPGSLENYLQEAGRAGRDRDPAICVLLFNAEDVERQFSLSARSRLARHEISAILKALRRLDSRGKQSGEVVATPGEIVREETAQEFERDNATDDTRVKTAVAWLEESTLLTREENRVQVFPSSLRIRTMEEAEAILSKAEITGARRKQLLDLVRHLMTASPDAGVSTDELSGASGLTGGALRKALSDLEALGIATDDTAITTFVHVGVEGASKQRFQLATALETALIAALREASPDAEGDESQPLHLAAACQALRDQGHPDVRPYLIEAHLRSFAQDGRDEDGGRGNIHLRKVNRNTCFVRVQRSWDLVSRTAEVRRRGAELLLQHLEGLVAKGTRGKDIRVETTMGKMQAAITGDVFLKGSVRDVTKLLGRALMWLHEQGVITLGRGLTIFRPAITVNLRPGGGQFTQKDFLPLEDHYSEQTVQTHIMAAYAERGLASMKEAERLSQDYFQLDKEAFLKRWMPDRAGELRRQTTPESWRQIVESLSNSVQSKIVADDREQTNVLVLAGPGSGKTRVLVHRVAYLIRVRREDPRGILVLTYNRHASVEIRKRLRGLIGDDANSVTVSTCHALAMRLAGASFADRAEADTPHDFDKIVMEAVTLLKSEGLSKVEAEALRETLIQGYRWILVDEYQDIGPEEYALIAAVAGRSLDDPDQRLSLFAVGDDDQNIYAFAGASIEFIRRFEADYSAKPTYLIENYRSTAAIIDAANRVIVPAADRMKKGHDITINRARAKAPQGGTLASQDPVAQGRVQFLRTATGPAAQANAAVDELVRLSKLVPDWSWSKAAIIAREWRFLEPVRSYCEARGVPVMFASEAMPPFWRLREVQAFFKYLKADPAKMLTAEAMQAFISGRSSNRWWTLISDGIAALGAELGQKPAPVPDIIEWLAEWIRDTRQEQRGLMLLTAHRAKGLEFDDVIILDGGWDRISKEEDRDAPRRLFYVAVTRARRSLAIVSTQDRHPILREVAASLLERRITPDENAQADCGLQYQTIEPHMVDLSWVGRQTANHRAHRALERIQTGDSVELVEIDGRWEIRTGDGVTVGRMAQGYRPPDGSFIRGEASTIIRWRKVDNAEEFRGTLHREAWEVVLPEFVFRH